jgi:hypothetical protein
LAELQSEVGKETNEAAGRVDGDGGHGHVGSKRRRTERLHPGRRRRRSAWPESELEEGDGEDSDRIF